MSQITIAERFRLFVNSAPILTAKYFFNNFLEEDSKELHTYIDEIKTGKTPPKSNSKYYESPDMKWYKPSDIGANIYLKTSGDTVSLEAQKDKKITLFKKDTLLITCIGDIGRIGILQEDSTSNQQITGIKLSSEILPEYAYLYLVSNRELFTDRGVLKTTLPIINQSKIKSIMIKVPDKVLQQQIINYFMEFIENGFIPEQSNLDIKYKSKIEQFAKKVFFTKDITEKLSNNNSFQEITLTKLKQSILQEAIEGKLTSKWREQNQYIEPASILVENIIAEKEQLIKKKKLKKSQPIKNIKTFREASIPESWQWAKGDELFFTTKLAGFEYTEHIKLEDKGDVPVIRAQNVRPYNIKKDKLKYIDMDTSLKLHRCALTKSALLVTFIGAGIGDVALFNENKRWHLAPNVAKQELFEGCEELLSLKFINYYLMSNIGRIELFKHVKATAQPSLSMGTIRDIDYPIPPTEEQKEIVNKIEKLFAICDELEEQINGSQENTQILMQAVLKEAFER